MIDAQNPRLPFVLACLGLENSKRARVLLATTINEIQKLEPEGQKREPLTVEQEEQYEAMKRIVIKLPLE